jgi:alanyl-tRNA synthetase
MMICDGVLPSNEGRGYVLRRLLRRAARHGKLLGVSDPFLHEVCDTVIHENRTAYPDLVEKQAYITRVIRVEEENFAKTIDGGLKIFSDMLSDHKAKVETTFSGADAFKLYDTYGFPIDLTIEMAQDEGLTVDEDGFHQFMDEQRQRARKAREALGDLGWAGVEFGKDIPETEFVGYDHTSFAGAKVVAMVVENEQAEEVMPGVEAIVVLDKTPFYAEMGGQVGDHGALTAEGVTFQVTDVQKNKGGKYMHYGKMVEGTLKLGDTVTAAIDTGRRQAVARAHSATHLLDKALRTVLGDHVHQAGSLVEPDRVRFDFTHFSAMTAEEVRRVSDLVNDAILAGYPVRTDVLPIEEARQRGAIALFGEKYGDTVRVVDMGDGYSVEFCGGTHLSNTAMAGPFRIKSEFSVASGVRRIEATTGRETLAYLDHLQTLTGQAAAALKAKPEELKDKAESVMAELKQLGQTVEKYKAKEAADEAQGLMSSARDVGGVKVITAVIDGADGARLRQMGDMMKDKDPAVAAVLSSVNDGKITFLAVCGKDAISQGVKAGDIIKHVTAICSGKGGGKPDSAMGGGTDAGKLDEALSSVPTFLERKVAKEL